MKLLVSCCALGLQAACSVETREQDAAGLPENTATVEAQLAALAQAGIVVNAGVVEADLTTFQSRADLERTPYVGLVEVLGIALEREPFTPICDRLWMCDFECIEDHGSYAAVVERLELMTGGALHLANIEDHVDLEAGEAWVAFDVGGERTRWDLRVDDDWLDPQVLAKYDELLEASGSAIRLSMNQDDYGQVAFLGAFRPEEKSIFDALTTIELAPLAEQLR